MKSKLKKITKLQIKLNPNWVAGFIDGEGCFSIDIAFNQKYKTGWNVKAIFIIALHKKDQMVLELIQKFFRVGSISLQGKNAIQFQVTPLQDLIKIIDYFSKYPLLTQKRADFELLKWLLK